MAEKRSGFVGGLAAGVVATLLIGSALTEYWIFRENEPAVLQPATGGMQLTETPVAAAVAGTIAESPTPTPHPWRAGRQATATSELRLYADASRSSLVLDIISEGVAATITEPSGNYAHYPVEKDGRSWVRVRSEEGLVGWAEVTNLRFE